MAERTYIAVVSEGLRQYRENEITSVHFFRRLLIHLGFWPRQSANEQVSKMNVVVARVLHWLSITVVLVIFPISIFKFATTDFEDLVLAIDFYFIAIMITLMSCSLLYRTYLFDDAVDALDALTDAARRHLVQPVEILNDSKKITFQILSIHGPVISAIIPVFTVLAAVYCIITKELIIRLWYPYDYRQSPLFEFTLAMWEIFLAAGCQMMLLVTMLVMAFLIEAIKHLQILNFNLSQIVNLTKETFVNTKKSASLTETNLSLFDQEEQSGDASQVIQYPELNLEEIRHCRMSDEPDFCSTRELPLGITVKSPELTERAREVGLTVEGDGLLKANFRNCLMYHQSIIRFVAVINQMSDLILLHHLCCNLFPVILGIIYLQYTDKYDWKVVMFSLIMLSCSMNMGIICWLADYLADESENIREAIYSSDWTGQSEGFKRSMRIMMTQANQPLVLNIIGCIPLSMDTFQHVIQMVYSYYMSLEAALSRDKGKL